MHEDLFFTLGIVEAPFVESDTTLGRVALDAGEFVVILVLRIQSITLIGGHLIGVVHTADNNRLIRIAFQKVDHHLLANAWPEGCAPTLAGPLLRHTTPAG